MLGLGLKSALLMWTLLARNVGADVHVGGCVDSDKLQRVRCKLEPRIGQRGWSSADCVAARLSAVAPLAHIHVHCQIAPPPPSPVVPTGDPNYGILRISYWTVSWVLVVLYCVLHQLALFPF